MSLDILERVKTFLIRLVKDEDFRTQLMSNKVEEVKKVMADNGYNFSQQEFETASIKILELKELGEFQDLSEEELVGAVGGWIKRCPKYPIVQPLYGVVEPRPTPSPNPQPMYGIVIKPPIDIQPMYGVVIDPAEIIE